MAERLATFVVLNFTLIGSAQITSGVDETLGYTTRIRSSIQGLSVQSTNALDVAVDVNDEFNAAIASGSCKDVLPMKNMILGRPILIFLSLK